VCHDRTIQTKSLEPGKRRSKIRILVVENHIAYFFQGYDGSDIRCHFLYIENGSRIEEHGFIAFDKQVGVALKAVSHSFRAYPKISRSEGFRFTFCCHYALLPFK
jgi:hypothetical protein